MEKEKIYINYENITEYLKDKSPYIFVDEAEVIPGVSAVGKKNFPHNEWYFNHHYINNPMVPAVFQMEAIMQTGALAIHTLEDENIDFVYAQQTDEVEIFQPVRPGQSIIINVKIDSFKRGIANAHGEAYINTDSEGGGVLPPYMQKQIPIDCSKITFFKFPRKKIKYTFILLSSFFWIIYSKFKRLKNCIYNLNLEFL